MISWRVNESGNMLSYPLRFDSVLRVTLAVLDKTSKNLWVEGKLISTSRLVSLVKNVTPVNIWVSSLVRFEYIGADVCTSQVFLP